MIGDSSTPSTSWDPYMAPKLDFDEDYYSVLEALPEFNSRDLKKAYYKMVFQYHPDSKETPAEKDLSNKQMMVINGAYRVLKDPVTKAQYDAQRSRGLVGAKAGVKGSGTNDAKFSRSNNQAVKATRVAPAKEVVDETTFQPKSASAAKFWSVYGQDEAVRRRAAKAQAEFEENQRRSAAYARQRAVEEEKDEELYLSRGDGSIASLKRLLSRLKAKKERREKELLDDRRDWGQEASIDAINKRLQDIDDLRSLAQAISELEEELKHLMYTATQGPRRVYGSQSADNRDAEVDAGDDGAWWNKPPRAQPQPQPQKKDGEWNERSSTTTWWGDDDGDDGGREGEEERSYRTWRDEQRRRPRDSFDSQETASPYKDNESNPYWRDRINKEKERLSSNGTKGRPSDYWEDEYGEYVGEGDDRIRTGRSKRTSSARPTPTADIDDVLSSARKFRRIADEFENFIPSPNNTDEFTSDEVDSWERELMRLLGLEEDENEQMERDK